MAEVSNDGDTKFCPQCGKPIINACLNCGQKIRGWEHGGMDVGMEVADYCPQCGEPFPWQTGKLEALAEAIGELEGLSPDEKEKLSKSIPDLIANTPKTETAVRRVRSALAKADATGRNFFMKLLTSVVTDDVNKLLRGDNSNRNIKGSGK